MLYWIRAHFHLYRYQTLSLNSKKIISFNLKWHTRKGQEVQKNGRDSNAQRLGIKVYGNQPVKQVVLL